MSNLKVQASPTGTGVVTLVPPTTNTDRTVTLPDQTGTVYITGGDIGTPSAGNGSNLTNLNASNLSSGTVATARLASGTADSTTFLRGDQTWAVVASPSPSSTAQAQAGTDNTTYITPLRMREGFNASGSAPVYACRAWVNFNGQGTVAIRSSGNVSSISDLGTGYYQVNFTTAMPDANYSIVTSLSPSYGNRYSISGNLFGLDGGEVAPTTTTARIATVTAAGLEDLKYVTVTVMR